MKGRSKGLSMECGMDLPIPLHFFAAMNYRKRMKKLQKR
jgi:hypothetical protein